MLSLVIVLIELKRWSFGPRPFISTESVVLALLSSCS